MKKNLLLSLVACAAATQVSALAFQNNLLTTNGDFEAGDTSGWNYIPSPNSTFDVIVDAASGSFAGSAENTALASAALCRQLNLGLSQVEPGDLVRVSFSARGTTAVGGVVFAEFFSEGTPGVTFLGGGPLPLTPEYRNYCFTTVAGPNVSGGVSLQFTLATGGATGSMTQLDFDNVRVEIDELLPNGNFELGGTNFWNPGLPAGATFMGTTDSNSGGFAAILDNPTEASTALAFQERIGEGEVEIGDTLDISFAAKGAFGPGGVLFCIVLTQDASGGITSTNFLGGGPLFPGATYEDFNFQFTPTTDVSGGIRLDFRAGTGAVTGSTAQVTFDDVSIRRSKGSVLNICTSSANSTGMAATMGSMGSPSIAADDFVITASNMPASTFCLFVTGMQDTEGSLFNGTLCIDATDVCRIGPILLADGSGFASRAMPASVYATFGCPSPMVGDRVLYQCWYRDMVGAGGNLTDALCVVFGD